MSLWRSKKRGRTFSVVGLAVDDGSTFIPAMVLHGDVKGLLAGEDRPYPGSVLYVVSDASTPDQAAEEAVTHFEVGASREIWERGDVRFI